MSDAIQQHGIVGAGGAGFPTAVKLSTKVSQVLVNGAECEPLLHKDKELLLHHTDAMLKGLRVAMERTGAKEGVIGIKVKYHDVIDHVKRQLPNDIRVFELSDTYPSGDEFLLVHDITGRVIPPGGLPKDVDTAVCNVETLMNIGYDRPVTHKYLTVAGAVARPSTLGVPVGVTIGEVIEAAGGTTTPQVRVLMGGAMMGKLASSLDVPVTKTLGGLIVLPADHPLIRRYSATWKEIHHIGKAACDQCRFCTDLCPRFLLGHPIEPHAAMRALGFGNSTEKLKAATLYCCECNLCSLFSCPEDLDPKNVCVAGKPTAREMGWTFKGDPALIQPHPAAEYRRIPTKRLMVKLGLMEFRNEGPLLEDVQLKPKLVTLPLKQHVGAPAAAVVKPGAKVSRGDLIAEPAKGALGARIHASIDGTVRSVDENVVIEA